VSKAHPKKRSHRRRGIHLLRRRLQQRVIGLIARFGPAGDRPPPDLRQCRRILLVFVNFRLGSTVLVTPGVAALVEALPEAELDFLGGPAAPLLLERAGLHQIRAVRRADLFWPHRLWRLRRSLRAARYDVALHLGTSATSLGALLVGLCGAPHRIGCRGTSPNVHFTSALPGPRARHKLDRLAEYLSRLGIKIEGERVLRLTGDERAWAERRLGTSARPRVAFFVGGRDRKGKAWPVEYFAAVRRGLAERGAGVIVFVGPEERERSESIRAALDVAECIDEPDLRRVAALIACCDAALAPDSGPMHLSLAVGTPTVALFRKPSAERWGPRAGQGEAIVDPEANRPEATLAALLRRLGGEPRPSEEAPDATSVAPGCAAAPDTEQGEPRAALA